MGPRTTSITVSEICYACGFNNPISKFFKKKKGVSPAEYRKLL